MVKKPNAYGVITDANGEVLPGTNVAIKGTFIGTAARSDGRYEIEIAPGTYTLVVNFIGYTTMEKEVTVNVGSPMTVDFQLEEDVVLMSALPEYEHHRDDTGSAGEDSAHHEIRREDGLMQRWHDGQGEIPGNDAVHRDRQRNNENRKKRVGPVQAVPFRVSATPA